MTKHAGRRNRAQKEWPSSNSFFFGCDLSSNEKRSSPLIDQSLLDCQSLFRSKKSFFVAISFYCLFTMMFIKGLFLRSSPAARWMAAAAALWLSVTPCGAQTSLGTSFWTLEMPNYACRGDAFAIVVANPNPVAANVVISHQGTSLVVSIPSGDLVTNPFPVCRTDEANSISTLPVYHITSDVEVSVYSFNPIENVFTNDASLVLPVDSLGKKYRVVSYRSPTTNYRGSEFAVIATQDVTMVNVFDNNGTSITTVLLDQGERFLRVQDDPVMTVSDGSGNNQDRSIPSERNQR